ncbi:MAG: TolC family protein, partial [Gammaproteobacteria bacterium]
MPLPRSPCSPVSRCRVSACALALGGSLLLLGACSTRVPHPLLDEAVERQATAIDLVEPPALGTPVPPVGGVAPADAERADGAVEPAAAAPAEQPAAAPLEVERTPPAHHAAAGTGEPGEAPSDDGLPADARDAAHDAAANAMPASAALAEPAQLPIGIADVRSQAISNNLEIQTELVRPALLREDRREAEARFLPTAFARYNYSTFDEPGVPPTRNPNGTTTDDAELGIVVPLQTGGSARVSVPITRTDFGVPGVENVQDAAVSFSLSQPLLRDAGRHVNLAPITVARLLERQQDAQTKLAILNVLAGSDRFYWNLYAASRAVTVRLEQYERAKEQERQATRLAAEGVVPAIEVVRARAGVARRVEDVIRAENTRRQVEREIKRAMNHPELPVTGATTLLVTTPPEPVQIVVDRPAAITAAAANRMELLSLELQLAVDALTIDVTRNQKLPSLALDYSFRYLGASNELAEAFEQIGRTDFANQSIGLTLEVPLGNQAREARYNRAVLQRALTAATRAQQHQIIERQVLDTIDQLDEAWQRILAAREETLLAARNFQAEQRQFRAGVRTSTDVLIAADFLADAQIKELNALAAYEIAKIDLAFVTGTLLGSGRVELASFDETHDIEAVAEAGLDSLVRSAPRPAPPTQESIARKLDRLGV